MKSVPDWIFLLTGFAVVYYLGKASDQLRGIAIHLFELRRHHEQLLERMNELRKTTIHELGKVRTSIEKNTSS